MSLKFVYKKISCQTYRICTHENFMSIVHVLPAAESKQAHIKFKQVRNTYHATFVIIADFESILKQMERRSKQTI